VERRQVLGTTPLAHGRRKSATYDKGGRLQSMPVFVTDGEKTRGEGLLYRCRSG